MSDDLRRMGSQGQYEDELQRLRMQAQAYAERIVQLELTALADQKSYRELMLERDDLLATVRGFETAGPEYVVQERDEAELRIRELEAELHKYEPSDGVMMQRLGDLLAIKEADALLCLFEAVLVDAAVTGPLAGSIKAWRALPVVAQARKLP